MEIKQIYKGESITFNFVITGYDMTRLESYHVYIGSMLCTGTVNGNAILVQLKSNETNTLSGVVKVTLWIDDVVLGVRKIYIGNLIVSYINAIDYNESVSMAHDVTVPITISETAITVGDVLYNYVIGRSAYQVWLDAGNTGTVEDFLADIKGDPFTYNDLTPEQKAELKGDSMNISNGAKTNADAGVFGQISITDDYMYICVMSGSAGSAIWKKTVLFQI